MSAQRVVRPAVYDECKEVQSAGPMQNTSTGPAAANQKINFSAN